MGGKEHARWKGFSTKAKARAFLKERVCLRKGLILSGMERRGCSEKEHTRQVKGRDRDSYRLLGKS